ncbi:uncharacterized protein [Panulirus ornatus]|uniref:uncharacterized protein isoform X1 n=1 Tax=Panulirus ornatus TaxID=150431 RepID=UPI003A850CC0
MVLLERIAALGFVEKVGVSDGEDLLSRDPVAFINSLLKGFMEHVPFQSVSMIAVPEEERHIPSLEEVVEAGLSLEGGVCFTLNTFMCIVLRALGFHAHVLDGSHKNSPGSHTHVVVLLQDLRFPGDLHIVDVGGGYPFFEAVAMADLPLEYYQAGLHRRYESTTDMGFVLHRGVDHLLKTEDDPNWDKVFDFNMKPVDYNFFYSYMDRVYVKKDGIFLNSLRAIRFPAAVPGRGAAASDGERVMVAFKDQSLLLGPMDSAEKTKVSTADWAARIKHFFPTIPPVKVDVAVGKMLDLANTSP